MVREGFNKFFWGFLFMMFDFRIQGIDILPDVVGFILFAMGFQALAEHSGYFVKAKTINLVMIVLSVFSIYEQPAQGEGIHINPLSVVVGLVSFVLILVVVHYLFMGIRDMAVKRQRFDIEHDAAKRWTYFLVFQIASLLLIIMIFIPPLFFLMVIVLFVAAIALMVTLMSFMKKCGEQL